MNTVVRKAYLDYEKEEKFLNKMAAKGLALKQYSWCKYVFEETPKNEYIYRIQLLEHPVDHPESQSFIAFMEDTGAELVTSYNRWVYFRKKAADGPFEIYTDLDSKIKHYESVLLFFVLLTGINLFVGLYNYFLGYVQGVILSTYFALISFTFIALLVIFMLLPLVNKISALKKEKQIRE